MKALELSAPSRFTVVERPDLQPGPGEVVLAVQACGICGSDLHGMDGRTGRRIPPVVMGHEASGVIAALGPGVDDWQVGDRVTFDSTVWCGECGYCRAGRVNLCDQRQVVGVSCAEFHRDGAFAEQVVLPARILHSLPAGLSFAEAAFAEPVGVALHALRRAGSVREKEVLVIGAGLIGLLLIQALASEGAVVTAVDQDQSRLELAMELGAQKVSLPDEFAGSDFDLAFEVVGIAPTVALAVKSLVKGGRLVLVGNLSPEVPLPLQAVVTRELDVLGSCAIAGEYPAALEAIASGAIRVQPLISASFSLGEGARAFAAAGEKGALKVMVTPAAEIL
ncbi:zinc-dependent alcohol dehydrogenase [Roseibacillus ishigakijimensis]|uniref:Alcohol dehydrogenase catalytic domain-containing protein n=1 Tax=Roseibacillus ishigakijimensis TaxID=454146 RepID=A0A934VLF9_9BACT|nr:alcohol dehydrogenase catalytic domain-containing protein [Roseibacillus ishigakijimensis]MBK1832850.1 alcohol dehydrogenase catalytic domain-containing protein [Roseibacillus ishigakijimensis]